MVIEWYVFISLDALLNSLEEIVIAVDSTYRITFLNRTGEERLGVHAENVLGKTISKVLGRESVITPLLKKTIGETRPVRGTDAEIVPAGNRLFDFACTPVMEKGNTTGAVILLREKKGFFDKDAGQYDSMGYLLSTVAHEVKNPLAGIKGAAQLLKGELSGKVLKHLEVILKETDRLDEVVKNYLFVGRNPVFNRLNIHEVIEEAVTVMIGQLKKGKITLRRAYDPSLPAIKGDEGKLLQVFLNIIKNASEAMPDGGTLEITTKPSFEYLIEKNRKKKKRFGVISFTDSGTGIAKENIEKIFLPFFTSKKSGTGLGLAISQKIILDHRGLIKVRPVASGGTVVDVYLPLA